MLYLNVIGKLADDYNDAIEYKVNKENESLIYSYFSYLCCSYISMIFDLSILPLPWQYKH